MDYKILGVGIRKLTVILFGQTELIYIAVGLINMFLIIQLVQVHLLQNHGVGYPILMVKISGQTEIIFIIHLPILIMFLTKQVQQ